MAARCINIKGVKASNKSMILKLLFARGGMSRKEIARETGLTPAAITQQITEMIADGIIAEMYPHYSSKRAGRKEIIVDIPRELHVCVGVAVSAHGSRICLMDFTGKLLYENDLTIERLETQEGFADALAAAISLVIAQKLPAHVRLVGCGLGLTGIVSGPEGLWLDTYALLPERNIPIRTLMQARLNTPVSVEDNVRAMANAEVLLSGYASHEGMLFLKYGPGLGAAIIIGNSLYPGYNNKAVEIGHMIAVCDPQTGQYGRRDTLENLISYKTILGEIKRGFTAESYPSLFAITQGDAGKVSFTTMLAAYSENDPGVTRIISRMISLLVCGCYNALCAFDPRKIVLYGEAFENARFFGNMKREMAESGMFADVEQIGKSAFNTALSERGAASLAISRFLEVTDAVGVS